MIDYSSDPIFWQRFLKCAGFYSDTIDGDFGKNSLKAAHDFEKASIAIANELGAFDGRSELNIQTLLPAAQRKAREFMKTAAAGTPASISIKIISGTRTFAEQDELYSHGRTKTGPKVTNARGGGSNHNYGVAWDIGVFKNGQYLPESPLYAQIGTIGKSLGLEWGGDWKSLQDEPHFQMVPEKNLKLIAAQFEVGTAFV
jgi:peptidoglycan L-alanyl-D-glutamate endopeptidase CwlK